MGTVRREGDWRLEKRGDGVYEVTFRKEPQLEIVTADSNRRSTLDTGFSTIPLREVSTYQEAEGIFEDKAHGPPPLGMEASLTQENGGGGLSSDMSAAEEIDLSEVTPGELSVGLLIAGAAIIYVFWGTGNSTLLYSGIGLFSAGTLILGYSAYLFKTEDWGSAVAFLQRTGAGSHSETSSSSNSEPDTTPPAPESLKNDLIFERANSQCEYCGKQFDSPDVHHIVPRKEGGPNERSNLIVLCPNCHRKADRGVISRSKLRYHIRG